MAYYAVLAAKGFIPVESLAGFGSFDSLLGYHPDRVLVPGVEISSGSLGHGLPIAVGMTLALDTAASRGARVFCLVGDGELDEGSNWEAVQLAGRLRLDASPRSSSTTRRERTAGPAASSDVSRSKAGTRRASTDGTTTRSRMRSDGAPSGRAASWRRCGDDDYARPLLRDDRAGARRRPRRRGRARRHRSSGAPAASAHLQRRDSRAGDDRRCGRARARGLPARRALVRAVPRRAALRAAETRPRPPERRRGARQRRCLVRRGPLRPHASGTRGCAARRDSARLDDSRPGTSG